MTTLGRTDLDVFALVNRFVGHGTILLCEYLLRLHERTREALQGLSKAGPPDACHGYKLRYVNPASGGAPIATMGTFMQLLPKGFATAPYRSTDGTIFSVVEGEGESVIGEETFRWKKRDHFVVPSWASVVHRAKSESVLFSFSDRPVQEKLDLWREDRSGRYRLMVAFTSRMPP